MYSEIWDYNSDSTNLNDKSKTIFPRKNVRDRYEYDSIGRWTKHVLQLYKMPITVLMLRSYDSDGKEINKTIRINDTEFWD